MPTPPISRLPNASPASGAKPAGQAIADAADAPSEDAGPGKFASVLDKKVSPPAADEDAGTGAPTAADAGPDNPPGITAEAVPTDFSALMQMIAAQMAAITGDGRVPGRTDGVPVNPSGSREPVSDLASGVLSKQTGAAANPAADLAQSGNFDIAAASAAKPGVATPETEVGRLTEFAAEGEHDETTPEPAIAREIATAEPAITPHATRHGADAAQPTAVKVETPVSSPRWSEDVAEKVMWITHRNENRAELVLTPANLGRIEVTVTQSPNGDTSVLFVAASSQARDALEQSLPRLREILGDAGISLGQTGVNAESSPRHGSGEGAPRQVPGALDALAEGAAVSAPARPRYGLGMVDTFA